MKCSKGQMKPMLMSQSHEALMSSDNVPEAESTGYAGASPFGGLMAEVSDTSGRHQAAI
jgi:hypothetical protein